MKQSRKVVIAIKEQKVKFSIEDLKLEDYNDDEFAIANVTFLSTSKNQHKLIITEEVLRENAKSVLGKWLVGEYDKFYNDVTTHTDNQQIFGYFPPNQEVVFMEDRDIVKASANAIISKIYSKQLCDLFADEKTRKDVSVEMLVNGDEHDDGSTDVDSFRIVGVTVLGKALGREVHGSCPDAEMNMVRFSMEDANRFYESHNNSLAELQRFSEERRKNMADKYKINKTELKDTPWGDVDKTEMRNKIMEASNRAILVNFVYMLVEDGWKDAPSEHLKYPVAQLVDDTFYYNRYGLASALAYAKQEGEDEVVSKIEKIYDKFNLDVEKKEDMAMKEIEFAAVNLNDMWEKVYAALNKKDAYRFYIVGLYEEDNKKFAVIKDSDANIYKVDYSYTEEGLILADEYQKVEVEFVPTDDMKKFAEPENAEKYTKFADDEEHDDDSDDEEDEEIEMSDTEKLADVIAQCEELKKALEDKENIIMEQTAELEELRKFKTEAENKEKMTKIDEVMCDVEKFLTNDQFNEFKVDGMACELSAIKNWENKVKAFCFSSVANQDDNLTLRITNPMNLEDKKNSVWDRL